jgi:hypothetical protein
MLSQWVRGSTRRASVELQEAVRREFSLLGEVWHGDIRYRLSDARIERLRPVVRRMYEETQVDLGSTNIAQIELMRGIRSANEMERVLESWTSDPLVARSFGTYTVIRESISASRVLAYHAGPGWRPGPFGDQSEYLVLGANR